MSDWLISTTLSLPDWAAGMTVKGNVEVVRQEEYEKYYGMVFSQA